MRAKLDDVSGTVKNIRAFAGRGSRYVISLRWRLKKPPQFGVAIPSARRPAAPAAQRTTKREKKRAGGGKSFPRV
jgi:hypothetical protein